MNSYLFLFVALFGVCTAPPPLEDAAQVKPEVQPESEAIAPAQPADSPAPVEPSLESLPNIDSPPSVKQPPLLAPPNLGEFVGDDQFYKMFAKRDDPKHMLYLALSWNARKQMDHFHYLKEALDVGKYAHDILSEAQKSITEGLKEANYTKPVSVEEFIEETYKMDENIPSDDQELAAAVKIMLSNRGECMQKLAEMQAKSAQLETAQDNVAVDTNLENAVNKNMEAVANSGDNVVAA